MKSITTIVGIVLIVFGVIGLGYNYLTYTKQEKIAEIGSVQVTAEKEKTVPIPPIVGGISLVAGIALAVAGTRKKGM